MSLAPIPVGTIGNGVIKVAPGWKFAIDDFNMDRLTFSVGGTLTDVLRGAPNKYDPLSNALFPRGPISFPNFPIDANPAISGLSCADRSIIPGEGLSAMCDCEYVGYLSSGGRGPVVSLTWMVGTYSITFDALTVNFTGPVQAQVTMKQGNTGAYTCLIGTTGNPTAAPTLPLEIVLDLAANNTTTTLTLQAATTKMLCIKHDRQEAGAYGAETQVWVLNYIQL